MTTQDHLPDEVAATLRARADDLRTAPLSFDVVRGRARSIQRRRRGVTAGAIAAALAAVLVVPALLDVGAQRADRPQPAPAPERSQAVPMLHRGTFTLPDGTRVDLGLRAREVSQFGVLTDGRIVVANQARSRIEVYDADGTLSGTHPVDLLALTMSPTDELAAWTEGSRVQVLESGQAQPVALAHMPVSAGTIPMVDAVSGDHCASGGCRAILSDGTETTSEVTTNGVRELATSRPLRVTAVSPDGRTWAVGFPAASEQQYGCVGLYDVASAAVTARTCATSNLRFAPDGEHLVGGFFENNMARRVTVLDTRLRPVSTYAPANRAVVRVAWADPTHLLAAVAGVDDQRWSLERVDIGDGSATTLEGPVAGGNPEITSDYMFGD